MGTTDTGGGVNSGGRKNYEFTIISKYIKHDLFRKIKFVYHNTDDQKIGEDIYKDYVEVCGDTMGNRSITAEMRVAYLQRAWKDACKNQIQNKALSQKRSDVYTIMQTKFQGTVNNVVCYRQRIS